MIIIEVLTIVLNSFSRNVMSVLIFLVLQMRTSIFIIIEYTLTEI